MSSGVANIILGLVGPLASGKGTVAAYLKKKYDAEIFRFSTPLRDALDRFYIPQTRKNMQNISLALRQQFGDDLLASVITSDVKKSSSQIKVVDGIRRDPDIKYLKKLPEFYLISVTTGQKTRWQRMTKRGENTDDIKKTFAQFKIDEQAEAEKHIKKVAGSADFIINNNGDFKELYKQVDNILRKINKKKVGIKN
ncbi:AAA family ATPase [Candidatus Falkowbacteria bacterium]|nr:AAA family ATPase [Candidatus Falkowbacteria bacterium]